MQTLPIEIETIIYSWSVSITLDSVLSDIEWIGRNRWIYTEVNGCNCALKTSIGTLNLLRKMGMETQRPVPKYHREIGQTIGLYR